MKKIITFAGIAILFILLSAPSFVKADSNVGSAVILVNDQYYIVDIYCTVVPTVVTDRNDDYFFGMRGIDFYSLDYFYTRPDGAVLRNQLSYETTIEAYIPTLNSVYTFTKNNKTIIFHTDYEDFEDNLPDSLKPTWSDKIWQDFYDLYYRIFGFYPLPGSLIYELAEHDYVEIEFPTNIPTPTPTPRPTPIPVQTIYVPSGNGDYTIIYQYPQPDGTITQSPYNPNIDVDVDVDCNCNGGSNNYNPQDPMYAPLDGLTWASVNGDLSESPAMSAGQSLDIIKAEVDSYDEPIKVVSNSFGALPAKWLGLVGLLGACLIVAGLIRTFLGG